MNPTASKPRREPFFARVRAWFLTGVIVIAPTAITFWVLFRLLNWVDNLLGRYLRFAALDYHRIPGLGLVATGVLLLIVGCIATLVGQGPLARMWDRLLLRIPGVGIVYGSTKSLGEALLSQNEETFRQVVLVQWPHPGLWAIAFLTAPPPRALAGKLEGDLVGVFVPSTPNPTAGHYHLVPRDRVILVDLTVEQGIQMIVSGGVVRHEDVQAPVLPH